MKRITDMLEDYQEDTIQLGGSCPLSEKRIKQLVLQKAGIRKKTKPYLLSKLAAAMVAVSLLTVSAAAAEYIWGVSDWFGQVFNHRAEQMREIFEERNIPIQGNLTQQQLAVLEQMGQVKNQSVTSQGTTITLVALCSDEYVMHLYFQVEAPEGTALPDGLAYHFEKSDPAKPSYGKPIQHIQRPSIHMEGSGAVIPADMTVRVLPDADPGDNIKDFHMILVTGKTDIDRGCKLNDGKQKTLKLSGLYVCETVDGQTQYNHILPGEFSFDITNQVEAPWVEVDVKDVTYERTLLGKESIQVELESLRISPLSAQWVSKGHMASFDIYMKDGSWATGYTGMTGGMIGPNITVRGYKTFHLPIDLDQIDYVLVDGNQKVYVTP